MPHDVRGLSISPVFHELTDEDVALIADHVTLVSIAADDVLMTQGDAADALFVVVTGSLDVTDEQGASASHLGTMGPGDVVGEIALVSAEQRTSTVRATSATTAVRLTREGVEALVAARPDIADRLAGSAGRRLRHQRLQRHLLQAFPGTSQQLLEELSARARWELAVAGQLVFAQGDPADHALLVVSGRLRVSTAQDGADQVLAEIGPGRLVGESALIDGGQRTASVRALRDTELACFPRDLLHELVDRHPHAVLDLVSRATRHNLHGQASRFSRASNIVVVPLGPGLDEEILSVAGVIGTYASTLLVTSRTIDAAIPVADAAQVEGFDGPVLALEHWLAIAEDEHEHVVHVTDLTASAWTRRALRRADRVIWVADATASSDIGPLERQIRDAGLVSEVQHTLLLVHPRHADRPRKVRRWLAAREMDHLHLRRGLAADHERVARLLIGRGVAVAFGGGGARGFAHLGVIRALREAGVPIDRIAGSSIGAVIGAMAALEWTDEQAHRVVRTSFPKQFDPTLPVAALLRGRRLVEGLERHFGEQHIEDCWIPLSIMATDLTTASSIVVERGPIAFAVRSSVSLPGVLPPVPDGHDLLVDGGVLDNLPISAARRRGDCDTIIAADVAPLRGPQAFDDFGSSVSGWSQVARRIVPGLHAARIPSVAETVIATMLIASRRQTEAILAAHPPELHLQLTLEGVGLLDFSENSVDRVAETGHASARAQIDSWLERPASARLPRRLERPEA